jgi:hypothetical protein
MLKIAVLSNLFHLLKDSYMCPVVCFTYYSYCSLEEMDTCFQQQCTPRCKGLLGSGRWVEAVSEMGAYLLCEKHRVLLLVTGLPC